MYDDMGVEDRMPLAELRLENAVLFQQLRDQAEATLRNAPPSQALPAYMAEHPVTLDMKYVECIGERLKSWNGNDEKMKDLAVVSEQIARRIDMLATTPLPSLPDILLGSRYIL